MTTRRLAAAFFAIATASLSLSAFAEPSVKPAGDVIQQHAEPLRENRLFRLTADEAHRMRGAYQLDDGRTVEVTSQRSRLFAQIDGRNEELVPVAENTFVSRDSRTRFAFNHVPFADEVVVTPAVQ